MRRWLIVAVVVVVVLGIAGAAFVLTRPQATSIGPAGRTAQDTSGAVPGGVSEVGPRPAARSDWYEVYFTEPKYPDDPKNHRGGLDEKLAALIDQAQRTLDVADYDFDLANVADAMARAKRRGVRVRMVTDTDTVTNTKDGKVQSAFKKLKDADIPIVDDQRQPIMHNKFTIVDAEWVSTGSWNYTDGDSYHLNNWMGIFHSKELAENYTAEFEQMFARKFGPAKQKVLPHPSLTFGDTRLQTCFSPKGKCADLIVDTLRKETKKSLYFMAFSFTHDGIGKAIVDKQKAGVSVSGVFEKTGSQTPFSEYGKMKKDGLDVYTDGNPWVMHHKVIVIDERIVVAGSFNFSTNADDDNDENLLIVDDAALARAFKAEFDRVLEQAKHPPAQRS